MTLNLNVTLLLAQMLLLTAGGADLNYCIFAVANEKFIGAYLLRLSENQMSQVSTLVNLAADWRIVVEQ